jgi:hypothetical protein
MYFSLSLSPFVLFILHVLMLSLPAKGTNRVFFREREHKI